ncbi:aldo/keto reductase [Kaistia dalseonensis]|uniref:Aryl-alcohol dehydrogenase-like predicted oxidoreductase n=1 Tax=Kaistia dalseonensis TaxID=410840 RepID=A0ABU0H3M8_9HYPH|nr:aldo/keto reductase [Kaistia dalseonensis]MCX5494309.1 aldo/keto reductase [Kaistia dalseonensis]MDQ0436890.1 aryl-alcohol dehydrogenase-like predicted oxidoreductase [Kaistia dalseonensis]
MEYRSLGRTDIKVSAICLGTMTYGQQNTEAEGHEQLDYALDQGINFLDTAELYSIPPRAETQGSTERIIGTWLKARGNRDKVIIASKVVGRTAQEWFRGGRPSKLVRDDIRHAIEGNLKRLQTDYIDVYQLHWPDRTVTQWGSNPTVYRLPAPAADEVPIEETLAALDELVKEGKIRHVGLSNESAWGTMRFLSAAEAGEGPRVVSIQNAYNLLNRTYEVNLAEVTMREQVGLLAYSPLAQGYLSGKYQKGARPEGARTTLFKRGDRYETPGAEEAIEAYLTIAREAGIDPSQLALAFVTSRPFVTSNIIGATTMTQLKADIASQELVITPELEAKIDAVHQWRGNPCP